MTTALAVVEHESALAPIVPESKFALLRDTIAKGATSQEFELFVGVCNRLRLDPFARQIYAVKRWNGQLKREEMTPQVSIDGFRLTAERTGKYAGQGAPEWCGADGIWRDVWLSDEPPMAARVSVLRKDFAQPIVATALYSEYVQKTKEGVPTKFWKTMPANQLAKCAESLALRKAFPNELSGVYSVDEMGQADNERPRLQAHAKSTPPPALPPPAAAVEEVPLFSRTWPAAEWAGRSMSEAPPSVISEYIDWIASVLADKKQRVRHDAAKKAGQDAEAYYERVVAAEMDRVKAAAAAEADPVIDGLERVVAERSGIDESDTSESWGLTP